MKKNLNLTAYVLLLPALLLFCVFTLYPLLSGLVISFFDWDGFKEMSFVGIDNYKRILADSQFRNAFLNNIKYACGAVVGKISISLIIALLLNRKFKGLTFFRAIYFLPVVLSYVAVGALWQRIYDPVLGLLNVFLLQVGIISKPIGWLADPKLALWALVAVDVWKWVGYHAVLFLAGLQTISTDYYEAADIDGASMIQKFRYITIPQLKPIIYMNITIALMGAFSVFDIVFIMTGGGPYRSTEVILTYMYEKSFAGANTNLGFGSAVAYLLFSVILIITIFQTRSMNKAET